MNPFTKYPFVRILFPFLAGILTAVYGGTSLLAWPFYLLVSLVILFFADHYIFRAGRVFRLRIVTGSFLCAALFLAGMEITRYHDSRAKENHFSNFSEGAQLVFAQVDETPVNKEKSVKIIVQVKSVKRNQEWKTTGGKAIVYLKKDSLSKNLRYGDQVVFRPDFREIDPPKNPGEFNYKQYLSFHQVHHQCYLDNGDWIKTGRGGNPVIALALDAQSVMLDILKRSGLTGNEYAVAAALILGYRDTIDPEIVRAYSASGAMHVLSVSGLHVGLVFIVLSNLLKFLDHSQRKRAFKAVLLLLFLWFYALLTGMSASVMRSAAMLSFVVISQGINRHANIYNTLCASAFVLLCFNPLMIMEVGFQLSYLAVFGIVYLQPKIYAWFYVKNKFLDKIWQITAVSLAAQIITFPLGLLYFHQFPNYFLASNLVVIPVATVILYLGIAAIITYPVTVISEFIGTCIHYCVKLLNETVVFIEQLPYSITNGISISITECWAIYVIMASVILWTEIKKTYCLFVSLATLLLFFGFRFYENLGQQSQGYFIVYSTPKASSLNFIDGRQNIFLGEESFYKNESKMLFHIRHNWFDLGVSKEVFLNLADSAEKISADRNLFKSRNYICYHRLRMALINHDFRFRKPARKLKVDYLILSHNPKIKLEKLVEMFNFRLLILDASNSKWYSEKILESSKEQNIAAYSVLHQGAFIKKLQEI